MQLTSSTNQRYFSRPTVSLQLVTLRLKILYFNLNQFSTILIQKRDFNIGLNQHYILRLTFYRILPWLIILLLLYCLNTHTHPDSSSVPQTLYFTRIYKIVEELNNLEITNSYCTSSIPTLGSVLFNLRFKLLLFKLLFTTLYHCRRHQDLLSYAQIQKLC